MRYVTMKPEDVQRILSQHTSCMPEIQKADEEARARIAESYCTKCGAPLTPRPVQDPRKLFQGTRIMYDSWCSYCSAVSEQKS